MKAKTKNKQIWSKQMLYLMRIGRNPYNPKEFLKKKESVITLDRWIKIKKWVKAYHKIVGM